MASAAPTVNDMYKCGFCGHHVKNLEDPRSLPCGHVDCIECLMDHSEDNKGNILCPQCGIFHQKVDISNLQKVTVVVVDDEDDIAGNTTLTCDRSNCDKQLAVHYCDECDEKLCDSHLQAHETYFNRDHEVVPIYVYDHSPQYRKVYCVHHKRNVSIAACRICYKLACNGCDRDVEDCTGFLNQHDYDSLRAVAEEITTQIKSLLESAANKRADIHQADKDSWEDLDAAEKVCKDWMKEVEKVRDEQIQQLTEGYEKVLEKIRKYEREITDEVESFNTELMNKKEQLEKSRIKVHRLMRDGHMADKVSQKQQLTQELTNLVDEDLGSCVVDINRTLVINTTPVTVDVDFIKLPSALTFSSEHSTGTLCFSACHREDGNILVGYHDGVKLLNKDTMKLTSCGLPYKTVLAATEHRQVVYILHKEGNIYKVEMCLPNLQHAQSLFEFENTSHYNAGMAVSDRYIVAYNPIRYPAGDVIIYDFLTKKQYITEVATRHYPYFLPNGELLIAEEHQLTKYGIESGKMRGSCFCSSLQNICRVCTDQNGLVYASTMASKKCLYIISPTGEKLLELYHEKLPAYTGQISVIGSQLAVSGWGERKLYKYNIT